MAIAFSCECGKRLKTPSDWGGRWVRCTACKRELLVPLPEPDDIQLDPEPAPAPPPTWQPVQHMEAARPRPVIAAPEPELDQQERGWRGYVYWLLLLAMIPLAVDLLLPKRDAIARLRQTIDENPQLKQQY